MPVLFPAPLLTQVGTSGKFGEISLQLEINASFYLSRSSSGIVSPVLLPSGFLPPCPHSGGSFHSGALGSAHVTSFPWILRPTDHTLRNAASFIHSTSISVDQLCARRFSGPWGCGGMQRQERPLLSCTLYSNGGFRQ